jgi:hypothetical protein
MLNSFSLLLGVLSNRSDDECFMSGMTLPKIMTAMHMEQSGSAMYQPNCCIRNDEIITPTLPVDDFLYIQKSCIDDFMS